MINKAQTVVAMMEVEIENNLQQAKQYKEVEAYHRAKQCKDAAATLQAMIVRVQTMLDAGY